MKLTPTLAIQHFRCTRLRAVLTRGTCARAHRLANIRPPGGGRIAVVVTAHDRCKRCPVGAEHTRGKASEPAVKLVQVRSDKPPPQRPCLACGKPLPPDRWRKSYCDWDCKNRGARLSWLERSFEVGL